MPDTRPAHTARGFTLIELVIVVSILGIIAAVAIPALVRARTSGNEASALGSLRAIHAAQSAYSAGCGGGGYAQTLADLAAPPPGTVNGFVSPDLSNDGVVKSGYVVDLAPDSGATVITAAANTCNASGFDAVSSYFAEAHPVASPLTGERSFATDTRGSIYERRSGAAIAPGMAGATVLQ